MSAQTWFDLTETDKDLVRRNLHPLIKVQINGGIVRWPVPILPIPREADPRHPEAVTPDGEDDFKYHVGSGS